MKATLKRALNISILVLVVMVPVMLIYKLTQFDIFMIATLLGFIAMNNNSRNNNNNNRGNGRGILHVNGKDKPRAALYIRAGA